jgi:hypothetical protein
MGIIGHLFTAVKLKYAWFAPVGARFRFGGFFRYRGERRWVARGVFCIALFFFVFLGSFCAPRPERQFRKTHQKRASPPVVLVECGLSAPKKILHHLVDVVARSQPNLAWIKPKAMVDLVLDSAATYSPVLAAFDLQRPFWFFVLDGGPDGLDLGAVVPVRDATAAKALMDRYFEPVAFTFRYFEYRLKDDARQKVYWKTVGNWLIGCGQRESLDLLEKRIERSGRVQRKAAGRSTADRAARGPQQPCQAAGSKPIAPKHTKEGVAPQKTATGGPSSRTAQRSRTKIDRIGGSQGAATQVFGPPVHDLSVTVYTDRLAGRTGLELKEVAAIVAVFQRLTRLVAREPAGLPARLDAAWSAQMDNMLTSWVAYGNQVEALSVYLDFGPQALLAAAEVSGSWHTELRNRLVMARPGAPFGLDSLPARPFFVYASRFNPLGFDARQTRFTNVVRAFFEGALPPEKFAQVTETLSDWWAAARGDWTVMLHTTDAVSKILGGKKALALTAAAAPMDPLAMRRCGRKLISLLTEQDLTAELIGPKAMVYKQCITWFHGTKTVSGTHLDWARLEVAAAPPCAKLGMVLSLLVGEPAVEFAQAVGKHKVVWAVGAAAKKRATRGVTRSARSSSKTAAPSAGLLAEMQNVRATQWIGFSLLSFIQETDLFKLPETQRWVQAARDLKPAGGPTLEWRVFPAQHKVKVLFYWPVESLVNLIKLFGRTTGNSVTQFLKKAANAPQKSSGAATKPDSAL